jgi:site-specific recombinase XerD
MVEKHLKEAEIEHASVQSLRHTMAVHHIARGTDLNTLSAILGDRVESLHVYMSAARKVQQSALQEHML